MRFIINNLIYETDNMENVAEGQKWERVDDMLTRAIYHGEEVGREYPHTLWKSKNGRWLLTHEREYGKTYGQAIEESEAKELLKRWDYEKYAELFGELPEA